MISQEAIKTLAGGITTGAAGDFTGGLLSSLVLASICWSH